MLKVIKNNHRLYLTWLMMLLCISLGIVTTNFLSVVALGIFVLFLFFSPTMNSCILLFGIMPFANIFKYAIGSVSFFTICELLLVIVCILKERKIKASFLLLMVLFAIYLFATDLPNFNYLAILKLIIGFYIIHVTISKATQESVINIAYIMSISVILMLVLSMNPSYFEYVEPYLLDSNYLIDSSGHASKTLRLSGFLGDPNYCSVMIIIPLALLSTLYYHKKIKNEFWPFIVLLIPLGFFTYSKSYFLSVFVLLLFLVLFVLMPKHKGWALVSVFALAILGFMTFSGKIEVINVILNRFSSEDITTGRTNLNKYYLSYIFNHFEILFFGAGISTHVIEGASNNVHNIYIETLSKLGIWGSFLCIATLLSSINGFSKKEKRKFANSFPLIFFLLLFNALAGLTMYELPFYIAVAFLAINFNLMPDNQICNNL